jgi:hypothetical protein
MIGPQSRLIPAFYGINEQGPRRRTVPKPRQSPDSSSDAYVRGYVSPYVREMMIICNETTPDASYSLVFLYSFSSIFIWPVFVYPNDTYLMHKCNTKCEVGSHSFLSTWRRDGEDIYSGQSVIHVCEGGQSIHLPLDVYAHSIVATCVMVINIRI